MNIQVNVTVETKPVISTQIDESVSWRKPRTPEQKAAGETATDQRAVSALKRIAGEYRAALETVSGSPSALSELAKQARQMKTRG